MAGEEGGLWHGAEEEVMLGSLDLMHLGIL
jgi:hypothetical protein